MVAWFSAMYSLSLGSSGAFVELEGGLERLGVDSGAVSFVSTLLRQYSLEHKVAPCGGKVRMGFHRHISSCSPDSGCKRRSGALTCNTEGGTLCVA